MTHLLKIAKTLKKLYNFNIMSLAKERFETEMNPQNSVAFLPSELLQNPQTAARVWEQESAENPAFVQQIAERAKISTKIDEILEAMPNGMSIESALVTGAVTERQAEAAYTALSKLLADTDYERLVLYLPFELLPHSAWQPNDDYLDQSITAFKCAYLYAWWRLLSVEDVRANFVDGDVLETELRVEDVPRVVKAAHLVPKLVERGMITTQEVIDIYTNVEESQLQQNLAEALQVLADMGYVPSGRLETLGISYEAIILPEPAKDKNVPLEQLTTYYKQIAIGQTAPFESGATENRLTWLKRKRYDDSVTNTAQQIAQALVQHRITRDEILTILPIDQEDTAAEVYIEATRHAIEMLFKQQKFDTDLFVLCKPDIIGFLASDNSQVYERAKKYLRHAQKIGYMSEQELAELGIDTPKLYGNMSDNLATMPDVVEAVSEMTKIIANDSYLSAFMLPVLSLGGSRLKGYGEQTSDIDICIFIKPGVSYNTRRDMRGYIREFFKSQNMDEHPIEFWLDDIDGVLRVKDLDADDQLAAGSTWTHILFDTVLIGDKADTDNLILNLLPSYFKAPDITELDQRKRALYLERIEQNLLQYRLLHKGYERHYPRTNSIDTPHAAAIDGASVFWDAGYRRIATSLFAKRVFLPKL